MGKIEKHKIGAYINQLTGFPFESSRFNQEAIGYRLLRGINITRGNLRFSSDNEMFYEDGKMDFSKYQLMENDIVISMDGSLVGRNFAKVKSNFLPLILVQRVARIRANSEKLNQDYLYQFFTSEYFVKYVDSVKTSSGIPHISSRQINDFEIPVLPINEQKYIAKVLGDFDKTIEKTTLLIHTKDKRKKALLQNLVLGKVRFKEFKGDWTETEVGEILDYEQPTKYLSIPQDDLKSGIPVLTANKSFLLGYTNEKEGVYTKLPVIIFDDFTTDTKYVNFPFKVKSSAIKLLQPKSKDFNLKFIFERMSLIQTNISDHKRRFISEYQYTTVRMPSIAEQNKIASVLIDADTEIQKLKSQLEKLKLQKQGLIQQLLSGKLRVKI